MASLDDSNRGSDCKLVGSGRVNHGSGRASFIHGTSFEPSYNKYSSQKLDWIRSTVDGISSIKTFVRGALKTLQIMKHSRKEFKVV